MTRRKIVLSEGEDPRVIEAAIRAKRMLIAEPILLGEEKNIKCQITKKTYKKNFPLKSIM